MLDFQQKKNIRRIVFSRIMLVVLFLLIIFVGKGVYKVYRSQSMSSQNLANVENNYNELKQRREMLNQSIESLKTEEGVEEEIRQKFGVAKEGETVIVIVDSKDNTSGAVLQGGDGFWSKIMGWFK